MSATVVVRPLSPTQTAPRRRLLDAAREPDFAILSPLSITCVGRQP